MKATWERLDDTQSGFIASSWRQYYDNNGVNTVIPYMGIFALAEQSKTFPRSRLDSLVIIVSEFHETRTLRPSVGLAVKVTPPDNPWEQLYDKHIWRRL